MMEFTLLFSVAMGALTMYGFIYWEAKRGNAADCAGGLWNYAIGASVAGIFGGRLAAMIADGVNPLTHPGDIVIVRAGVATGPAALIALATLAFLARRELVVVLDGIAAAAVAGLAGWHAGCLSRDACLGTPSDLPWAQALDGSTITRHPVEVYAAILLLIAGGAVAWAKAYRRPPPLVPAGVALAVAGAVRLVTEPLRPALAGGPEVWYWIAVAGGLSLIGYSRLHARRASTPA